LESSAIKRVGLNLAIVLTSKQKRPAKSKSASFILTPS